jgi:uncharacterized membrane protein
MKSKLIFKKLVSYFLQGLLYTVPFAVIGYIVYGLFIFLDKLIPVNIPGLGLLILIIAITSIGFLGTTIIAQPIRWWFEEVLNRVPLLKTLYTAFTDLMSAFVGTKKRFNKPVMVRMNKEAEVHKLGFITQEDLASLGIKEGFIAVYLPHSYNFSGNLFIVPKENVTPIDRSTSDVMKFIVSGGVVDVITDETADH